MFLPPEFVLRQCRYNVPKCRKTLIDFLWLLKSLARCAGNPNSFTACQVHEIQLANLHLLELVRFACCTCSDLFHSDDEHCMTSGTDFVHLGACCSTPSVASSHQLINFSWASYCPLRKILDKHATLLVLPNQQLLMVRAKKVADLLIIYLQVRGTDLSR
jgi:hypothetical protein